MQILRARREAKVLEEKFGDEYREYKKRTWF
jgi:protein-S-isoprenylcysteine O-methyltransferase Ste14